MGRCEAARLTRIVVASICVLLVVDCAEAPSGGDALKEPPPAAPPTTAPEKGPEKASDAGASEAAANPASNTAASAEPIAERAEAGVCSRCHIVSVLEWGVSEHVAAGTTCQECHGPSKEHVANERNEIKPDRLPRGDDIASLCSDCHEDGCPETDSTADCQTCHHVHALVNPEQTELAKDDRLNDLFTRWQDFRAALARGEEQVEQQEWTKASVAFEDALKIIPGHYEARERLAFCKRRISRPLPGFRVIGDEFDPVSGLPRHVVVDGLSLEMVLVPPGEFDLGSDLFPDSQPVHTVGVGAYYLGKFEVTQGQWKQWMGSNPSHHQGDAFPDSDRLPAERISWELSQELIAKLNAMVPGAGFRLPTEVEWEYACRAGAPPTPQAELPKVAWFLNNSVIQPPKDERFRNIGAYSPRAVGTLEPNPWGFYDMQGNVWEWCSTLWRPYLYDPSDGRESLTGDGSRILRGGSYSDTPELLSPGLRHYDRPTREYRWNGLRLARTIPAP